MGVATYDSLIKKLESPECQSIGLYDEAARAVKLLSSENARLRSRGIEDLHFENESLRAEVSDLRDFHGMVINWSSMTARKCFEIIDRCKKYESRYESIVDTASRSAAEVKP